MRVIFLGTGTSRGIPTVGCDCRVCTSSNPKNKRLRSSILIESEVNVVIDTSVDFRAQMLRQNVKRVDAVLYTHSHADHILGLDDVYPFNLWSKKTTRLYASPATLKEVKITFRHLFKGEFRSGVPCVELNPIEGNFQIGDLEFEPVEVLHGDLPVLGFRVGSFAYVTDVMPTFLDMAGVAIPDEIQGQSWAKLLAKPNSKYRKGFFYEYFFETKFSENPTMLAYRTEDTKLIKYPGHEDWTELFDLKNDPYERKNLTSSPEHRSLFKRMEKAFEAEKKAVGYHVPDYAEPAAPHGTLPTRKKLHYHWLDR